MRERGESFPDPRTRPAAGRGGRLSLGASRGRLIRQFATEGALLCGLGAGLGLALGYVLMTGLNALLPAHAVPAEAEIALNRPVLLFTLGLMIVTTLVCALLPAIRVTRTGLAHALQQHAGRATGGPGHTRWNGLLVVVQVALAFALLATAGLLLRSIRKLSQVDPGVGTANLLTACLPIDGKRFPEPGAFTAYLRQVTERVAALPGVSDAALAITLPLQRGGYGMGIQIAGEPVTDVADRPFSFFKPVAPSYFQTVGLRLRRGRSLSTYDLKGAPPVAVINQAFARKYFSDRNPIGQRVLIREVLFGKLGLGADVPWEVVGVVSDERVDGLENEEPSPIVYASQEQSPQMVSQVLIVRSGIAPALIEKQVRAAISSVNRDQVVTEVKTFEQIKAESLEARRLQSGLLGGFAVVALLLAGLGIYGVLAQGVQQRARELGIRSALGASARQLVGHVLRRGMTLVGVGLALGLAVTFATAQVMAGLLFGVSERDPISLGGGMVLLSAVAWFACYLPGRRAAKVDPIICLRCE